MPGSTENKATTHDSAALDWERWVGNPVIRNAALFGLLGGPLALTFFLKDWRNLGYLTLGVLTGHALSHIGRELLKDKRRSERG